MSKENKCEGSCEEHRGEVVRVRVTDTGKDWGEFDYCEAAIEEDKRRGLFVNPTTTPVFAAEAEYSNNPKDFIIPAEQQDKKGEGERQCTACSVDQPYPIEIMASGVKCLGCGRTKPNAKYVLSASPTPPVQGGVERTNDFIHRGIEFSKRAAILESGDAYKAGAGFGYSCGYQDGFQAAQSDAIPFAEWIASRAVDHENNGTIHILTDGHRHTTTELYTLFKNKNKPARKHHSPILTELLKEMEQEQEKIWLDAYEVMTDGLLHPTERWKRLTHSFTIQRKKI